MEHTWEHSSPVQVKTQSGEFIYDSTEVSALPLLLFGAGETLLPPPGCLLRLGAGGRPLLDVAQEEVLRSHAASLQVHSLMLSCCLGFAVLSSLPSLHARGWIRSFRARARSKFLSVLGEPEGPPLYVWLRSAPPHRTA